MIDSTTVDVEPSAQDGAPAATDSTVSLSQNGEDAVVGPANTTPMGAVTAEGQPPRPRLDVVGYLRVVRRRADLSQRDLARALGAPPSRIGDLEAERRAPRVDELERILAQAQLRLAVVDDHGEPVQPEPRNRALDASGRRLPAHLDPPSRRSVRGTPRSATTGVQRECLSRNGIDVTPPGRAPAGRSTIPPSRTCATPPSWPIDGAFRSRPTRSPQRCPPSSGPRLASKPARARTSASSPCASPPAPAAARRQPANAP